MKLVKSKSGMGRLAAGNRPTASCSKKTPSRQALLNMEKRDGTFVCAACSLPLFDSKAKYESGNRLAQFLAAAP